MEIKVKAKKWGSSIGFILPKPVVDEKGIEEDDEIIIEVKQRPRAGELFGILKGKLNQSPQEIKNEMKEGWLSQTDKERERKWKNQK